MSFRIEHRLGVAAPAAAVWDVLKEIEAWPQWTDLYPKVSGALRIGGGVSVTEQHPGQPAQDLRATILDWVPEDQIHWRVSSHYGLLKRTRYFEIEVLSDTGCIFSNGEIWSGLPTRYIGRGRRRAMRQGFEAMGEALKAKVLAGR